MADGFVALSEFFRRPPEPEQELCEPMITAETDEVQSSEPVEAFGELRRFRAAVRDAVGVAVTSVLCDVAAEVLARELELKPANVAKIVARASARAGEGVVCVRAHPSEVAQLFDAGVEVIADPHLRRGDVLLQVCSGTIDVTLGARLAAVLGAVDS